MSEFLSAGVFTEEVRSGESAILGVSTSTFASAGWLPRGLENKAVLTTSLPDYFRKWGGYWKNSDLPLAATAFFKNGGSRAYFVRVCPSDATAATASEPSKWKYDAISRGAWGNNVRLVIRGNENNYDFNTAIFSKYDIELQEESSDGAGDFAIVETFEAVDLSDADAADYFPEVVNDDATGSKIVKISDLGGGIPASLIPSATTDEAVDTGDNVQTSFAATLANPTIAAHTLKVKVDGVVAAKDNGRGVLTLVGTVFSGVSGSIDYETGDLAIAFTPAPGLGEAITADYIKKGVDEIVYDLSGGTDGTSVSANDIVDASLSADKKGLYALDDVDEVLNIGLPDFDGDVVAANGIIDYCAGREDCFAILGCARGIDAQDAKIYRQVTLNSLSSYGALYYPGVKVSDPLKNGRSRAISAVGHIAGRYAYTDQKRNVAKAPAGTVDGALAFTTGLERVLSKGERDLIYPVNINPLIDTPATGRAIWGARTLELSGDFTLVPVRRLFIFLKRSVWLSTQDLVFEPIGDDLFSITSFRMTAFLNRLTSENYFSSRVPAEAFRVVVDNSNNTDATKLARQLITDILVSTQTPGEFIRFRFQRSLKALS